MKDKILLGLSFLFGLMFINSGVNKFFNYMPIPDMPESLINLMTAFADSGWLIPLIAIVEIIAGLLMFSNKYRPLGAIMIFPIVVGILLAHIFNAPAGLPIALGTLAINLWIIYENRDKYMPMIS